jgi:hypothetical protein
MSWTIDELKAHRLDPDRVDLVSAAIQPHLHGLHPGEQGAVIADLFAIWLAGQPAHLHERLILAHIRGARQLIPLYTELLGKDE